jgi:uncharacterized protein YbdZ (MbtH family)
VEEQVTGQVEESFWRMFASRSKELPKGWRKLHNEELPNSHITWVATSKQMTQVLHATPAQMI